MKNVSHSPVTEMLSGRHKIWLLIGLALLPIADLSACIVLWVFGAASSYWALPFVMAVGDIVYLLCVVLSNQRFKYAKTLFLVYILFTVICIIVWLAKFASNPLTLANTVLSAWALLHVFGIVAVTISYLYSTRRFRAGRHVQLVLAIIFSAVVLLCAVFYGVTVIGDGYFGQGHGNLPLVYSYIGDDECEVVGVVYGNGDSVVIPYEFNGRKVTGVSANVFTYANVKSVTLKCDPDVELCTDSISSSLNTNIKIYVDKKDVDTIKQKLYNRGYSGDFWTCRHALGNNVEPIGLDKDEVFVTFNYDRDAYENARAVIIPTWFGKKGDTFKLSDIEGVNYAAHSDADSDDDLYYSYFHVGSVGGGFIMSELQDDDNKAMDGMTVNKSRSVPVSFQRIYKVSVGESNDDMYDPAEHFSFTSVNGVEQNYKLTVLDKADELLESFDRGEAFIRTMQYAAFNSNVYREFTSLSMLLREGYSEIRIAPHWELAKPTIALSRVDDDGEAVQGGVIYGDDYKLSAAVTHPLDGVKIEYEWYDSVQRIGIEQSLQQHASNVGIKTFTAIAKVSAPQITSCVSTSAAEITVSLLRRPITVKWRMEGGDDVYDGNPRQILTEVENAADGEIVTIKGYNDDGYAGTFTKRAEFVYSNQANYYSIVEGSSYTYTIKPCPVPLTWDEQTEFEYDRKMHYPTAHALDLSGNELLINYSGYGIDAGDYSTSALILNTNYTIDDASKKTIQFKITPKPVTVVWSTSQLTYNGNVQAPQATSLDADILISNMNIISVSGGQIDANVINGVITTTYIATATSTDKNYKVIGDTTCGFVIEPYGVTVNWTNTTVTYNGQSRLPNASAVGVKNQVVPATVSIIGYPTGAVNADSYTAIAALADTNYTITSGGTHAFTINKMTVSPEWGSTTLTYNGQEQTPTATAKGVNGENLSLTVTGGRRNVGGGTATAAFAAEQQNYVLANVTTAFTIQSKVLNILVNNVTIEYGQTPDYTYEIAGIVSGDDVTPTYSANYTLDENGNIPVGEYTMTVTLSGADSGNYQLNVMRNGKLIVTAPTQTTEE